MADEPRRKEFTLADILPWLSTSGLVIVIGWAFGVREQIAISSTMPARITQLEARLNLLEREVSKDSARIDNVERRPACP